MSARLVEDVYQHSQARGGARALLLAMCHVTDDKRRCFMGVDELARRADLPRSTLYRAREELLALGEIAVTGAGGGRGKATVYALIDLARNSPAGGTVTALNSPAGGTVKREKTVPPGDSKPSRVNARAGDHEFNHENSTPLGPPKGGQHQEDLSRRETAGPVALAARRQPGELTVAAVWERVQARLRLLVDDATYRTWLEPMQPLELDETRLVLQAPPHRGKWASERFGSVLQASVEPVLGAGARIELRPHPDDVVVENRGRRRRRRAA